MEVASGELPGYRKTTNPRCGTGSFRQRNGPIFQQHEGSSLMQTTIEPFLSNAPPPRKHFAWLVDRFNQFE